MRIPLLAANWKMYKTPAEARSFISTFLQSPLPANKEIAIFPPAIDLQAALDADPAAAAFFATLSGTNRYSILHRVMTAVKPETRARRIHKYVAMCAAGEKIYP